MIKYSFRNKPVIENYWEYCCSNRIPHIEIVPIDRIYVNISYDILSFLPYHNTKLDLIDRVKKLYEAYCDFFKLSKNRQSIAGGDLALGFVVKKEHSEYIASHLYDYLIEYVKKYKSLVSE